ncbi:MAG: hypothetical protein AAGA45_02035 [Verrucomicrobiota bacterium]
MTEKKNRGFNAAAGFMLGAIINFFWGYAIFLLFAFVFGAGIMSHSDSTATEVFFMELSMPTGLIIFFVGSICSAIIGGRTLHGN